MTPRQAYVEDVNSRDHSHNTGSNAQHSHDYQGDKYDARDKFCNVREPGPYVDPGKPHGAWKRIGAKNAAENAAKEVMKAAAGNDFRPLPHPRYLN